MRQRKFIVATFAVLAIATPAAAQIVSSTCLIYDVVGPGVSSSGHLSADITVDTRNALGG